MEDRSSRTSIIVALIAIVLIVGGIFLLNQSISGQQNEEEPEDEVVVVTPEDPDPTNFQECQDAGGFVTPGPPRECTLNGQTFVEATSESPTDEDTADEPEQPVDEPEEDTTEDSDTNDDEEDTIDNDETDITLQEGEITAEVTSVSGNNSKYTVVESNNPAINTGAPMELVGISSSFGVNLEVGSVYKMKVNAQRVDGGFQINSIESVTKVS